MTRKLSARETIMIFAVVVLIICIAGIKFVITPLSQQRDAIESEYAQRRVIHELEKADAARLEELQEKLIEMTAKRVNMEAALFPYKPMERLDLYLNEIYERHKLNVVSAALEGPGYEKLLTWEQEAALLGRSESERKEAGTDALVATAELALTGELSNFIAFVDELSKIPYLGVTDFYIPEPEEFYSMYDVDGKIQIITSKSRNLAMTIRIEVIMGPG